MSVAILYTSHAIDLESVMVGGEQNKQIILFSVVT